MQELLKSDGMIIVISVLLLIWISITLYIFAIDKKLNRLEKTIKAKEQTD
jgi:CcmD family protein